MAGFFPIIDKVGRRRSDISLSLILVGFLVLIAVVEERVSWLKRSDWLWEKRQNSEKHWGGVVLES